MAFFRSQFVQSLLLSSLSISDEKDDPNNTQQTVTPAPEEARDDTANPLSLDSVTSNAPAARASDYEDAKKKQESASRSDLDLHPHLSRKHIVSLKPIGKMCPNRMCLIVSAPQAQQRSSSKPKTGSSKSNQSQANPQATKPSREKPVSMPSDTR